MRNIKKVTILAAAILVLGATTATGFAASIYQSPADAVAGITGQTVESVTAERQETDKTYGKIAADAGKLDEFKVEMMEMKKNKVNTQVAEGNMTQEKADTIIKTIEERQANCDGTPSDRIGQKEGARFGSDGQGQGLGGTDKGQGNGQGQKLGNGLGNGNGQGNGQGGMRIQDGSRDAQSE